MTIRLIATDLDGTFFDEHHGPHPRNVAAINALVDQGVVAAVATGRSYFGGLDLATSTGAAFDWFIGSNGGHRVRVEDRHLEERLVFEAGELDAFVAGVAEKLDNAGIGFETENGFWFTDAFIEHFPTDIHGKARRNSEAERPAELIGKMFICHPELATKALLAKLAPLVPTSMYATTSGISFVEVTPQGADKGAALSRLCANLGIDASEVIAFGDNYNDVTMLEWAGRGVAMANAADGVKDIADEVTGTNGVGGVAEVLETLLR